MAIFTLKSVKKDFGIKEILRDASFSLDRGDKVGLIGTNGSGKSTLLKMVAGLEPIDGGELWVNSGSRVVYLPQQPAIDPDRTVLEEVFASSGDRMALIREYETVSHQLALSGVDTDRLMSRLSSLSQQIEAAGAWDLEVEAKTVLTQLGIQDFEARVGDLSGGYRKRIAIAAALLSEPDALLMDEPTNHLDASSAEWLQSYLSHYRGALLLITHDRYFLDQVTNRIIEIDRGDLFTYDGNYGRYLEQKAEAEAIDASSQRKHAGLLRRELEWLKRGPKARSTKQKARIDRIEAMQTQEFKQAQGQVAITTASRRIGKKVVELHNLSKSYGDRILIQNFTYTFSPDDRVGIIGPNGVGKSTLLNLITGRIAPDVGQVDRGETIHIGYFDQHSDDLSLSENQRVIDYLKDVAELVKTADGSVITASQMLERFLFTPNQQYAPIQKLSGGERRRLFLLRVLMSAPNLLILDEPTNDLDVQTLAVLEEYLESFSGCVIVVSHDRYFLDRVVNTLFAFEPDGTLRQYPGNYSVYLDYRQAEQMARLETEKDAKATPNLASSSKTSAKPSVSGEARPVQNPSPPTAEKDARPRKLSFKEKREYETLEARIPQLEAEKTELEQQLYTSPIDDFTVMQEKSERLAALVQEIDQATERWLELAERDV